MLYNFERGAPGKPVGQLSQSSEKGRKAVYKYEKE
jgi:hypothetical protein